MTLNEKTVIIAIDGPAASGKGTLARKLADRLGFSYLDTGKLYRAVGLKMLESGANLDEAEDHDSVSAQKAIKIARNIELADVDNSSLSNEGVGAAASIISAIPSVRAALLDFQRDIASSGKGAVLDGRDIGTVICPDADFKFYITADLDIRAKRRYKELQKQDNTIIYDSVLQDLQRRDDRDIKRKSAPMQLADDAILIDTSDMAMSDVFDKVLSMIALPLLNR